MNTLFKKDLRENIRLALIGLPILALICVLFSHGSTEVLERIARGESAPVADVQPLLTPEFLSALNFFCALFGAALGWFQTRNESHRDLWAFLVHRPITRTQIFWGKTSAGFCLYLLGAGLPLLGMILYVRTPGAVAAPFEPAMALPACAIFLTGFAYYFAGMLTGLRQARWFGSRIFGLGGALATSVAVNSAGEFWEGAVATVLLMIMLAIAAWGAYQSGGFYRGQPFFGRLALTLSLAFGCICLLGAVSAISQAIFGPSDDSHWQSYHMGRDGRIYVETRIGGVHSYSDLAGKPALDPATGKEITQKNFYSLMAGTVSANAAGDRDNQWWDQYSSAPRYFTLWNVSGKTLWYLDRYGKLLGFDGVTRQPVTGPAAPAEPFLTRGFAYSYFNAFNAPHLLSTRSTVYRMDFADNKLVPIASAAPGDPILGFAEENYNTNVLVLTPKSVRFLTPLGSNVYQLPYQPDAATYPSVQSHHIDEGTNRFSVWFSPDYKANEKSGWKLPIHVLWLSERGEVTRTLDLPNWHFSHIESTFEKVERFFSPIPFQLISDHDRLELAHWLCLIPTALCLLIAWRLLRRYHFSVWSSAVWLLFIVLLGIPALLTFLFAQEFPKRETCPNCGQPRVVDNDHCEHCAAPFAPPDKIGIEIFEPLTAP